MLGCHATAGAVAAQRRRMLSIDISYLRGAQQQTRPAAAVAAVDRGTGRGTDGRTDVQTDARPFHRPCYAYHAASVKLVYRTYKLRNIQVLHFLTLQDAVNADNSHDTLSYTTGRNGMFAFVVITY